MPFRYPRVTSDNRGEYVKLALNFRLHEVDTSVACVREGMARVVPVPLLSLFTGYELETMVCGSPDIPLHLLKSVATYKGNGLFCNIVVDSSNLATGKKSVYHLMTFYLRLAISQSSLKLFLLNNFGSLFVSNYCYLKFKIL